MNLEDFFGPTITAAARANQTAKSRREARRQCDEDGHPSYQVHGRKSPNKIECPRCRCTWAIGPKTEPTP